jgi:hypothetical protein
VTRHTPHQGHHGLDEPWIYEDLVELWQTYDEPLSPEELDRIWHPGTPRIVWVARAVLAVVVVTVLVGLPSVLRAVGS